MKLSDFNYHLPQERIAQTPAEPRDSSKLMVIDRNKNTIDHDYFYNIGSRLRKGDLLVRNNTKVIPARLLGHKATGGAIEVLLNKRVASDNATTTYEVLTKPGIKIDQTVHFSSSISAVCIGMGEDGYTRILSFPLPYPSFLAAIASFGQTPLPPYIHVENPNEFEKRYQTLYAKHPGSAASPTAGLHMTETLEESLLEKGVQITELTLHVGLGTFLPVKSDDITKHHMHSEIFDLPDTTAERINAAKRDGRRVIAVGTTTTRVLETCADEDGMLTPQSGETSIYIYPPYRYKVVDGLITNFHLPQSTLLMLVSALVSAPNTDQPFESFHDSVIGKAYAEAIAHEYRFFSFGDGMLIV